MKHLLLFLFGMGLFVACDNAPQDATADNGAQTPTPIVEPTKPSDYVALIKADYAAFADKRDAYTRTEAEFEPQGGGGSGKFIRYSEGETLRMLREEIYDNHGPITTEYYFRTEGELYFVYEYSELQENAVRGATYVTEDRYYLNKGVCLQHLNKRNKFAYGQNLDMGKVRSEEIEMDPNELGEELRAQVDEVLARSRRAFGETD
ncbi:MAG: hypothetical protein AAF998_17520 [Bacteroidota bacterium]